VKRVLHSPLTTPEVIRDLVGGRLLHFSATTQSKNLGSVDCSTVDDIGRKSFDKELANSSASPSPLALLRESHGDSPFKGIDLCKVVMAQQISCLRMS